MQRTALIRARSDSAGRKIVDVANHDGEIDATSLGRWLRKPGHTASAIVVSNGELKGQLDLVGVALPFALEFSKLVFERPPLLAELRCRHVVFADCCSPGIDLARSIIDAFTVDRCTVTGAIDLDSARIEHGFGIHDSSFGDGHHALRGCWIRSNGSLGLARVSTAGMIDLLGSQIGGELWLEELTAEGDSVPCLRADLASVSGSLTVQGQASGELSLSHVSVNGDLDLRQCTVDGPTKAITADSARIAGRALLSRDFTATGRVLLVAAEVRDLDLRGATIRHDDTAVELDRLVCRNDLDFEGANVDGGVRAEGALVGGNLVIKETRISSIRPADLPALALTNAVITGTLLIDRSTIVGGIKAPGIEAKNAALVRTTIDRPGEMALSLLHARIATQLKLLELEVSGAISLAGASTVELDDEPGVWRRAESEDLSGFVYQWLQTDGWTLADRLDWLRRRPRSDDGKSSFRPATYDALASSYRAQGEPQLAIKTLIAREDDRLSHDKPTTLRTAAPWLARQILRVTVAHGYRPGRAIALLATLVGALTLLFRLGPAHAAVLRSTESPAAPVAAFNPFVFSLDTVIPLIDFGEAGGWRVDAVASWAWLYRCAIWVSIATGWILSTLLVAAVATLSRSGSSTTTD